MVLDGRLEPVPEAASVEDGQAALGELAGVYVDADRTLIVELTETAARVQGNEFAVVRRSDGTFAFAGLPIAIATIAPGSIRLDIGGEERLTLTREPGPARLELDGRYRSEELDVVYEIDGRRLRRGYQPWEDLAVAGDGIAGFSHGVITAEDAGFVVNTGRAGGLRFDPVS